MMTFPAARDHAEENRAPRRTPEVRACYARALARTWMNTTPVLAFHGVGYAIRIPGRGYLAIIDDVFLVNPAGDAARWFSSADGAASMAQRLGLERAEVVELYQQWRSI